MNRTLRVIGIAGAAGLLIMAGAVAGVMIADSDENDSPTQASGFGGYIGMSVSAVDGGLRVTSIEDEGPADEAGVATGDILRFIDGEAVQSGAELDALLQTKEPGDDADLTLERDSPELHLTVTLAEQPQTASAQPTSTPPAQTTPQYGPRAGRLGVQVSPITPDLKERFSLDRDMGIVVLDVQPDSPAADAGFAKGDIIAFVGDVEVGANIISLQRALARAREGEAVPIRVVRATQTLTLTVKLEAQATPTPQGSLFSGSERLSQLLEQLLTIGILTPEMIEELLDPENYPPELAARVVHGYVVGKTDESVVISRYSNSEEVTLRVDADSAINPTALPRPAQFGLDDIEAGTRVLAFIREDGVTLQTMMVFP